MFPQPRLSSSNSKDW